MKIKITLLPVAFNNKLDILNENRNILLTDNDKPISRYIYSESVEECLKKLCEEYLFYSDSWLDIALVDFRRASDSECEAVYLTQFPHIEGFHKSGTLDILSSKETIKKLGEYYVGILSTHTTRRFAT